MPVVMVRTRVVRFEVFYNTIIEIYSKDGLCLEIVGNYLGSDMPIYFINSTFLHLVRHSQRKREKLIGPAEKVTVPGSALLKGFVLFHKFLSASFRCLCDHCK